MHGARTAARIAALATVSLALGCSSSGPAGSKTDGGGSGSAGSGSSTAGNSGGGGNGMTGGGGMTGTAGMGGGLSGRPQPKGEFTIGTPATPGAWTGTPDTTGTVPIIVYPSSETRFPRNIYRTLFQWKT